MTDGQAGCAALSVHVPALARFPAHLRDLCAMLPVVDLNAGVFEALAGGLRVGPEEAVGLFLTDPFLNLQDTARRLAAHGVRAIANYPTLQALDGPSGAALASVGHGFDQECAALAAFQARGFRIVGYAGSAAAAQALAALGADRIVHLAGDWTPDGETLALARIFRHEQADAAHAPMP